MPLRRMRLTLRRLQGNSTQDVKGFQKFMLLMRKSGSTHVAGSENVLGSVLISKTPDGYMFGMLSVNPINQGKGIGSFILSYVDKYVKTVLREPVVCQVLSCRPELLKFYGRFGLKPIGKMPFPPHLVEKELRPEYRDSFLHLLQSC
eukprot:Nk52_evm116s485 gene=Nk52_evmTU116s485